MNLACPTLQSDFNFVETVVWSVCLLAPIATFLALPRLLPLKRELTWSRIKAQLPLAWLASRAEERGWRQRLRAAWRRDVEAAHPEGTARGEVVRDERLLARARAVGWVVGLLLLGLHVVAAAAIASDGDRYAGRLAVSLVATGLVMGWIGRVAGGGAALWAQALALGRGAAARVGAGFLVGAGYGAVAGFTATFVGLLTLVPLMSLFTLEPPGSHDMMIALTVGGVASGAMGAFVGTALLAPLTLFATRRK
jgi:hypothetical protein